MTTTSLVLQDSASVLILRSCLMGQVLLQCLDRHLRLTSVDVDPVSHITFSKVRDLTADMVLMTIILVGMSRFLFSILIAGGTVPTLGGSLSSIRGYVSKLR